MVSNAENTLPAFHTEFFGREDELRRITERLADPRCRLLTITGIGGIGKTRAAVEAVRRAAPGFEDAACFVELEQATDETGIFTAIAAALGIRLAGSEPADARVEQYLADRSTLLALDNFEGLTANARVVSRLLRQSPASRIVITSRVPLGLAEEWLFPLEGLGADGPSAAATRVFASVAERLSPGFDLNVDLPHVQRICASLDGLPLAIEMAASWVRALTVTEIADEVERNTSLLVSGMHDVPDRHRSMQAVFDGSWKLLDERQRRVFSQLSVFRGPFDREAATAVAEASISDLAALVDASLLKRNEDGAYTCHPALRDCAIEKLSETPGEAEAARSRLMERYSSFAARMLPGHPDPVPQLDATHVADRQYENFIYAFQLALERRDLETLYPLADFLAYYFEFKGRYRECMDLLDRLQNDMAPETEPFGRFMYANSVCGVGWMYLRVGDMPRARACGDEAMRIIDTEELWRARVLGADPGLLIAFVDMVTGDPESAEAMAERRLAAAVARNDEIGEGLARFLLSQLFIQSGEIDRAEREIGLAIRLTTNSGEHWFAAYCLNTQGDIAIARGDYAAAERLFRSSHEIRRKFDDPVGMGEALVKLGEVSLVSGNTEQAERAFVDAISAVEATGDRGNLGMAVCGSGFAALANGRPHEALDSFVSALDTAREMGFLHLRLRAMTGLARLHATHGDQQTGERAMELVRSHPASDFFSKAMAGGSPAPGHDSGAQASEVNERLAELERALRDRSKLTFGASTRPGASGPLTEREAEILRLAAEGRSNSEIAQELIISPGTVKWHTSQIYTKLNVPNRAGAVARAREIGLI